ncbi:Arm DNA-binding domain-containing protein [Pseudomonas sp. GD03855]|nr:Arm DNA-binding domain-containing protein [Pseudomonas sp. GD03909]MDH2248572.1 Arm DNA-binding domain-containing protein [Pseudomonas sp. GD03856]MDH2267349.1 Arm DNA-binding domain-containing protein [Pseudomonas sp. GD03855]
MDANLDSKALAALGPKDKPYKVGAGSGLFLEVTPNGSKLWRLKYRFGGKENKISLGAFPSVSLEQARKARDEARATIQAGIDPSALRKAERAERSKNRAHAKAFRLVMSLDHALTIETPKQILSLTPSQTAAVRAILLAVESEGSGHAANR